MSFGDRIATIVNTFVFDLLEAIFAMLAALFGSLVGVFTRYPRPHNHMEGLARVQSTTPDERGPS